MTKAQKLALARANARNKARTDLSALLATDAKPEQIDAILAKMAQDEADEVKKVEDEDPEPKEDPKAEDEDDLKDKPKAEDEDPEPETVSKAAMDKAIKIAQDQASTTAVARVTALYDARDAVKPLVGAVALDSAEEVYKFALDQKGVDTKGVHPSAYKPMVDMLLKGEQTKQPVRMAADAASVKDVASKPNFARIKMA